MLESAQEQYVSGHGRPAGGSRMSEYRPESIVHGRHQVHSVHQLFTDKFMELMLM